MKKRKSNIVKAILFVVPCFGRTGFDTNPINICKLVTFPKALEILFFSRDAKRHVFFNACFNSLVKMLVTRTYKLARL